VLPAHNPCIGIRELRDGARPLGRTSAVAADRSQPAVRPENGGGTPAGTTPPAPGSRLVLVTGASSGIARETAVRFARAGDTVVGVARHEPALAQLAEQQPGVEVEVCDLRRAEDRAALVDRVLARHGRVDVLVNNAGVGAVGLLQELTADDVERVYATNVVAVADLTRLVLPTMLSRGSGAVVVLSSVAAWVATPPATVYASSKFALDGLVQGLRRETRGTGVLVHSVNPGPIATPYLARVSICPPLCLRGHRGSDSRVRGRGSSPARAGARRSRSHAAVEAPQSQIGIRCLATTPNPSTPRSPSTGSPGSRWRTTTWSPSFRRWPSWPRTSSSARTRCR
jgi:short-subunit dehydrogenase